MGRPQRTLDDFGFAAEVGAAPLVPPVPPRARPPGLPEVWAVRDGTIVHPLLRERVLRALPFQTDLAREVLAGDTLIVLPTGLGKTVIAGLAGAEILRRGPGRLLFLAPTRPLVQQHADTFGRWFRELRRARFTGTVRHPVRVGAWERVDAVFATPEIVAHDLLAGRYDLKDVSLVVFDEAHRAVGKYAYVALAERYRAERPSGGRILGLTASPGGKDERVEEVVRNLGIAQVKARTRDDPGVREFVQPVEVEYRWVQLPRPVQAIQAQLIEASREEARRLQKMGYLRKKPISSLSVKDLIALRAEIFARPGPMVRKFGPLFHQLVLLHLHHAQDRLETQGVGPFLQYVERVGAKDKPSRGDRAFLRLPLVASARAEGQRFLEGTREVSHPKLDALADAIREEIARPRDRPPRVLVFAQYRDTVGSIQSRLEAEGWRVGRFVGQATRDSEDRGMSQRDQAQVLEGFRAGRFPVMVATSVAEEGLDVPDVDLVVFFEAIPSEIRTIQRRGRTGRSSIGRVLVLLTEATRDVGYLKAEVRRERAMGRIVRRLSRRGSSRSSVEPRAESKPPALPSDERLPLRPSPRTAHAANDPTP
jgi:ERCC4-related helicase